ncbi:Uncharacterized protein FWK35_00004203, partial [Aphis craccivora]
MCFFLCLSPCFEARSPVSDRKVNLVSTFGGQNVKKNREKQKKKKAGKWVSLCCTLGAVCITIIHYRREELMTNFVLNFQLSINSSKKILEGKLMENLVLVFPDAFENCWKFFTFDPPKYQLHSLSYQKQGPLFKIEALLLLQNVDTKKKKIKKKHIIVKSIHSSLRSESKITEKRKFLRKTSFRPNFFSMVVIQKLIITTQIFDLSENSNFYEICQKRENLQQLLRLAFSLHDLIFKILLVEKSNLNSGIFRPLKHKPPFSPIIRNYILG